MKLAAIKDCHPKNLQKIYNQCLVGKGLYEIRDYLQKILNVTITNLSYSYYDGKIRFAIHRKNKVELEIRIVV